MYPPPQEDNHNPSGFHELESAPYSDEDHVLAGGRSDAEPRDVEQGNDGQRPSNHFRYHDSESDSDLNFAIARRQWRRNRPWSWSWAGLVAWCKGPDPPHVHRVRPLFPKWQAAPGRLVDGLLPKRWMKIAGLLGCILTWLIIFFAWLKSSVTDQEVPGYGQPVRLSCHQRLWDNATNCGIDGELCLPFEGQPFAFRCPSGCAAAIILEPYNVGAREYNYRPLVIGGNPSGPDDGHTSGLYRGDSSICASALHAGVISDARGGCGILHRSGEKDRFESVTRNGITSIPFMPHFSMSFTLAREVSVSGPGEAKPIQCSDIRWSLFAFTLITTTVLSMVVTSGPAFFSAIYFISWLQVAMVSDPPTSSFYDAVSIYTSRFVPAAFVGFVLYHFWLKHTLGDLDAHLEKTVLWLGGLWVGALNTDTFDLIPISRLTPHDIQQQPGAVTALFIIVSSLIAITVVQAYCFRREGRFFPMLRVYALLVLGLVILCLVPHMNVRIHHDLLALLLLPGTSMQTRPSLLFQGILLGLYINGIARWGFGAILETPASMLNGARLGTAPPVIDPPIIENVNRLSFSFPDLPTNVDGISVLVNDVLRFTGIKSNQSQSIPDFTWQRRYADEIEYFRFAYVHARALSGYWYDDFTQAATWAVNGSFLDWNPS